jgi:hypothetical protein
MYSACAAEAESALRLQDGDFSLEYDARTNTVIVKPSTVKFSILPSADEITKMITKTVQEATDVRDVTIDHDLNFTGYWMMPVNTEYELVELNQYDIINYISNPDNKLYYYAKYPTYEQYDDVTVDSEPWWGKVGNILFSEWTPNPIEFCKVHLLPTPPLPPGPPPKPLPGPLPPILVADLNFNDKQKFSSPPISKSLPLTSFPKILISLRKIEID